MKRKIAGSDIVPTVSRPGTALVRDAGPQSRVIELHIVKKNESEPAVALTESEKAELAECERIIEQGLGTFFEVGNALLRIRESRLYRPLHSSFKHYCQKRWNIGPSYAWRVMGAAERLKLLPGEGTMPKPENEFQMRPFLKLSPAEFPGAWDRVIKTAKGKVTTRIVRAVIRDLLPHDGKKRKRRKSKGKLPVGQFLALVNEAKRQMAKGDTEKALAALERIEILLFKV